MSIIDDSDKHVFEALKSSLGNGELEISVKTASMICRLPNNQIIDLFRKFESRGGGKFVIGRHGKETRFVFNLSNELGAELESSKNASLFNSLPSHELVNYPFFIRPNLKVLFQLPSDLSSSEAERIAAFIRTLSLEKPHSSLGS